MRSRGGECRRRWGTAELVRFGTVAAKFEFYETRRKALIAAPAQLTVGRAEQRSCPCRSYTLRQCCSLNRYCGRSRCVNDLPERHSPPRCSVPVLSVDTRRYSWFLALITINVRTWSSISSILTLRVEKVSAGKVELAMCNHVPLITQRPVN